MALSNRERQALYRQRIRTSLDALIEGYRDTIYEMEGQVAMMESALGGGPGFRTHDGSGDTTPQSISTTRERIASLRAIVDEHTKT